MPLPPADDVARVPLAACWGHPGSFPSRCLGNKAAPASRPHSPSRAVPYLHSGQQGAAASRRRGVQGCLAGREKPSGFFMQEPLSTMRPGRVRGWLSMRGGGLGQERRWTAAPPHPRRQDLSGASSRGTSHGCKRHGQAGPRYDVHSSARESQQGQRPRRLGFPPATELRRLKHERGCPRSPGARRLTGRGAPRACREVGQEPWPPPGGCAGTVGPPRLFKKPGLRRPRGRFCCEGQACPRAAEGLRTASPWALHAVSPASPSGPPRCCPLCSQHGTLQSPREVLRLPLLEDD